MTKQTGLILPNRHTQQGALGFMFISNGELYASGQGDRPFSDSNTTYRFHSIPVKNPSDSPFVELSYNHLCAYARTAAGEVYSWGLNSSGVLGHGDTIKRNIPTKIQWFEDNNVQIAELIGAPVHPKEASDAVLCMHFLGTDGRMYGCGYNGYGQLGTGDTKNRDVPTAALLPTGKDKKAIVITRAYVNSPRYTSVYAIDNTGQLYVWGMNDRGHLGIGNTTNQSTPQKVATFTNVVDIKAALIDDNNTYGHALLLRSDHTLWGTGGNGYGQLGLGNTTSPYINWTQESTGKTDWRWFDVGAGSNSIAIDAQNDFYITGLNNYGQVGDGTTTTATKFTKPLFAFPGADAENSGTALGFQGKAAHGMITGSHIESCIAVVSTDGKMWTSGYGSHGLRATGSYTSGNSTGEYRYFMPAPLNTSGAKIVGLKTTGHTLHQYAWIVQLEDGRLLGAGDNSYGQLGLESAINHISYFTEIWNTKAADNDIEASKAHFRGGKVVNPEVGAVLPLDQDLFLKGSAISREGATITLQAGKTYKLTGKARLANKKGNFMLTYQFKNLESGANIGDIGSQILVPSTLHHSAYPEAIAYISPSTTTKVSLCVTNVEGAGMVEFSQVEVEQV
ncbi:MAG: RCC1 domain-containing protein [Chitinophagales bacterium]